MSQTEQFSLCFDHFNEGPEKITMRYSCIYTMLLNSHLLRLIAKLNFNILNLILPANRASRNGGRLGESPSWERVPVRTESQLGESPSWERVPVGKSPSWARVLVGRESQLGESQLGKSPSWERVPARDRVPGGNYKISSFEWCPPPRSRFLLISRRQDLDACLVHAAKISIFA